MIFFIFQNCGKLTWVARKQRLRLKKRFRHCAPITSTYTLSIGRFRSFLAPIGHIQKNGDYQESWQPQVMSEAAQRKAQEVAEKITSALGGRGIFGVELFVCGDEIIFNEVSPRPHDTGMVTMVSQELSQFALHARAILGLPIPEIYQISPAASKAIVVEGKSDNVTFSNLDKVLEEIGTNIRLFGKGSLDGHRRMGVILARDENTEKAREKALRAYHKLDIQL